MLITNIKILANVREQQEKLRGTALATLPVIENAFLQIEDGKILDYGPMDAIPGRKGDLDASGRIVLPAWCDSHTHLVFASSRENEFIDKIKGLSYAEIATKGGGILNSARKLRETSEDKLFEQAQNRLQKLIQLGTGAIEIKSGYGLSLEGELKMLRVIQRLKKSSNIPIKATFLGAHALPEEYKNQREAYIRLLIHEMLPILAKDGLADYIDVFCEQGFFTPEETLEICEAGKSFGLKAKIHANQLSISGGVQAGMSVGALSVDHLESIGEEEIEILGKENAPMATLLPSAAFFLRMAYPPARQLIQNRAAIALASDYNPGSSPSGNMNLLLSLACIQMKMLPEEAINAATLNGAYAMELENEVGSISRGKRANFILTRPVPSLAYLPYSFGENWIEKVFIDGK